MTFGEFKKKLREMGVEDTDDVKLIDYDGCEETLITVNRKEINHGTWIVEVYNV